MRSNTHAHARANTHAPEHTCTRANTRARTHPHTEHVRTQASTHTDTHKHNYKKQIQVIEVSSKIKTEPFHGLSNLTPHFTKTTNISIDDTYYLQYLNCYN